MNVGERLCWKILITHQRWVTLRQCTFVVTTVKKSEPANQLIVDSLQDSSVVYMKIHPMFQYQRGLWPWIRRTCFLSVLETITSPLWWICWIKSNDQVKILTDHQFLLGVFRRTNWPSFKALWKHLLCSGCSGQSGNMGLKACPVYSPITESNVWGLGRFWWLSIWWWHLKWTWSFCYLEWGMG